jgi:hypothetical protein
LWNSRKATVLTRPFIVLTAIAGFGNSESSDDNLESGQVPRKPGTRELAEASVSMSGSLIYLPGES